MIALSSQMNTAEMTKWVGDLLQEMFEIDPATVTPDAHLYHDLDIDSIDTVDIIVRLNRTTGKRIAPDVFRNVRTVRDVVDVLTQLLGENPP